MTKFFKGSVALSVLLAGFAFNGFALPEGKDRDEALGHIAKVKVAKEKGDDVNVKALAFFKKMTDKLGDKADSDRELGDLRDALEDKGFSREEIRAGRRN
jgi:hypothetical protein